MHPATPDGLWRKAAAYEPYMGRWTRAAASAALSWLRIGDGRRWLDVGCGTGALTRTIVQQAAPTEVVGVDPSDRFIEAARAQTNDPRARFEVGNALGLTFADAAFDVVVAGFVLNYVGDANAAVAEMRRVTRSGGTVGAWVWDYAHGMQMLRHFWRVAVEIDSGAIELDQGRRNPLGDPTALGALFTATGLGQVSTAPIDVVMSFHDFDDYWTPFLGGVGVAPVWLASRDAATRTAIRERLRATLPGEPDGSIRLPARAWAVRGER